MNGSDRGRPRAFVLCCATLLALAAAAPSGAANWARDLSRDSARYGASNLSLRMGVKELDGKWKPVSRQWGLGVDYDYGQYEWPASLFGSLEYLGATGKAGGTELSCDSLELDLGARAIWHEDEGNFWPYVGGGLAALYTSAERRVGGRRDSSSDVELGPWAGAGFYYRLSGPFTFGADLRWSLVRATFFGNKVNAGGWYGGATVGYHWQGE